MKNNDNPNDKMKEMLLFVSAAIKSHPESEEGTTFICPVCRGEAHAYKSMYNGHRGGHCNSCGIQFVE